MSIDRARKALEKIDGTKGTITIEAFPPIEGIEEPRFFAHEKNREVGIFGKTDGIWSITHIRQDKTLKTYTLEEAEKL